MVRYSDVIPVNDTGDAVKIDGSISLGDIAVSASTEYNEGTTVATPKGSVILWKDASDVVRAISASTPLPVNFTNASLAVTGSLQGNSAAGATDAGNPVKIGGVYRSTLPVLTNGQRGDALLSPRSILLVETLDIVSTPKNITAADTSSTTTPGANNQNVITGNPSNNSTASETVSGSSSFSILITGTFTGTLQFERSLDNGVTWTSIGAFSAGTNFIAQTTTLPGAFHGNASSSTTIRVRATAWTSGTATVSILAGQGTGTVTVGNPIRLFDAVSGVQASIKAASTLPLATDTAIVTTVRDAVSLASFSIAAVTNRAGTTSGTANTWTEVAAANTSRQKWYIQNPSTSGAVMEIGFGASGSEVAVIELAAGQSAGESAKVDGIFTGRIAIRCPSATSKAYYAHEA